LYSFRSRRSDAASRITEDGIEYRKEKAKVKCGPHDIKHTFCTKMAEAGVPEGTMLDMMGHVSTVMLRRYSHIRAQARREAIDALELRHNQNVAAKESTKVSESEGITKPVTH
jgi:integrase